jgi:hypothetical protein
LIVKYISDSAATLAGLILLAVGLTGVSGRGLNETSIAIIMLKPSGYGPTADLVYWYILILVGVGLVTLFFVRWLSLFAIFLVVAKVITVHRFVAVSGLLKNVSEAPYATVGLCIFGGAFGYCLGSPIYLI